MISNLLSPNSISTNGSNNSITYPVSPPSSPSQPESQSSYRLRLLLSAYSPGYVKCGFNKFPVDI